MDTRKETLNDLLKTFKVKGSVEKIIHGARITRFEIKIDPTQKLNPLIKLAGEIGVAFGVPNKVRISPIDSKPYIVGVEIPNMNVRNVELKKMLFSEQSRKPFTHTSFIVGEDIGGNPVVGNIKDMPHLLIAGTTGSGKSVFLNTLITSLIHNSTSEYVRFIMIDPKQVELILFENVPHLLAPIITDTAKAMMALKWVAAEMDKRYEVFAKNGIRGYDQFEKSVEKCGAKLEVPRIIVIIDELAELMMSSESKLNGNLKIRNEIETLICRIAAKARASGIHLVVATQRPSKDVVTGLIRDNLPSKVAFSVADGVASRIILDETGAEKLLGKGDLLYKPIGSDARRLQGAYISDEDIEKYIATIEVEHKSHAPSLLHLLEDKPRGSIDYEKNLEMQNESYEESESRKAREIGEVFSWIFYKQGGGGYVEAENGNRLICISGGKRIPRCHITGEKIHEVPIYKMPQYMYNIQTEKIRDTKTNKVLTWWEALKFKANYTV